MYAQKVKFEYPLNQVKQPIVSSLVKQFGVAPNILSANINPAQGGWLVVELIGDEDAVRRAIAWTTQQGVIVSDIVAEF